MVSPRVFDLVAAWQMIHVNFSMYHFSQVPLHPVFSLSSSGLEGLILPILYNALSRIIPGRPFHETASASNCFLLAVSLCTFFKFPRL
jgi:hypothetical protein